MQTIVQIAKKLKVNRATLSFRLWKAGIECSSYKKNDGRLIKIYNADAVRKIRGYLKRNPILDKGRPMGWRKAK